jgi:hypothetical protein
VEATRRWAVRWVEVVGQLAVRWAGDRLVVALAVQWVVVSAVRLAVRLVARLALRSAARLAVRLALRLAEESAHQSAESAGRSVRACRMAQGVAEPASLSAQGVAEPASLSARVGQLLAQVSWSDFSAYRLAWMSAMAAR